MFLSNIVQVLVATQESVCAVCVGVVFYILHGCVCMIQVPTRAQRGAGQCLHDVEPVVTGPLHRSQRCPPAVLLYTSSLSCHFYPPRPEVALRCQPDVKFQLLTNFSFSFPPPPPPPPSCLCSIVSSFLCGAY